MAASGVLEQQSGRGVAHKKHRVSCLSRWGCTWLAGVPVTFTFIVRRHLRETGTQSASPQTPCLVKVNSSSAFLAVIFNWEKSKAQFSLYLFIYLCFVALYPFYPPPFAFGRELVGGMSQRVELTGADCTVFVLKLLFLF